MEAFILASISPLILAIGPLKRAVVNNGWVRSALHVTSLAFLSCPLFISPTYRLLIVAYSVGASCIAWTADFYRLARQDTPKEGRLESTIYAFLLGLLLSAVLKMAWWANNPIWPIMNQVNGGHQLAGFVFGLLSCVSYVMRVQSGKGAPEGAVKRRKKTDEKTSNAENEIVATEFPIETTGVSSNTFAAFGVGAVFHSLHIFLTDSSLLARWTSQGYPNTGAHPMPHGFLVFLAMAIGIHISTVRIPALQAFIVSPTWWVIGTTVCMLAYSIPAWPGYIFGLIYAVYLMSVAPVIIARASQASSIAKTFGTGFFFYILLQLGAVWTVAYAFVPAGTVLRERTHVILIIASLMFGLSTYNCNHSNWGQSIFGEGKIIINGTAISDRTGHVYNSGKGKVATAQATIDAQHASPNGRQIRNVGWLIFALGLAVTLLRHVGQAPIRPVSKDNTFTAGIWTIHFALDNDMYASEGRIRDLVRDAQLDVVGEYDGVRVCL